MVTSILVIRQSRAGGTDRLVEAFVAGIELAAAEITSASETRVVAALDARPTDVLGAAAVVIATPEHFGSMAGATKHFFEEIWHDCLDRTAGLPWQLIVKAGNDGLGTIESVERLVTGLGWRAFRPPLLVVGDVSEADIEAACELGATLAVSLDAGLL